MKILSPPHIKIFIGLFFTVIGFIILVMSIASTGKTSPCTIGPNFSLELYGCGPLLNESNDIGFSPEVNPKTSKNCIAPNYNISSQIISLQKLAAPRAVSLVSSLKLVGNITEIRIEERKKFVIKSAKTLEALVYEEENRALSPNWGVPRCYEEEEIKYLKRMMCLRLRDRKKRLELMRRMRDEISKVSDFSYCKC
jgi:hypothetical protein